MDLLNQALAAIADAHRPKRQRYVVISTRQDLAYNMPELPRMQKNKDGSKSVRVLQHVMDLRFIKPKEQRKSKPWRHNESTSLMKRARRQAERWRGIYGAVGTG